MIWMMWQDDSKRTMAEKIGRAAWYYARKYGQPPNIAWANIEDMADDQGEAAEIRCEPRPEVLPGHLWIGVDDGEE